MTYTNIWRLALLLNISMIYSQPTVAVQASINSNTWETHHDTKAGYRVSIPTGWIRVPPKGQNALLSVNPPDGSGNCNIVSSANQNIADAEQDYLNNMIKVLPQDRDGWAGYIGLPKSKIRLIQSRLGEVIIFPEIVGANALVGVIETDLENLEGKYTRIQMVAMTFRPGRVWTLNCGVSAFNTEQSSTRFLMLSPYFNKFLGSFAFVEQTPNKAYQATPKSGAPER